MTMTKFDKSEFAPTETGESELWLNRDHVVSVYESWNSGGKVTCVLVTSGVIYTIKLPIDLVVDRLQ